MKDDDDDDDYGDDDDDVDIVIIIPIIRHKIKLIYLKTTKAWV